MPFLVIGGVTVLATEFERLPDAVSTPKRRTVSGQLRGEPDWVKREWTATAYLADDAAANLLRAEADPDAPASCSGDALGGAVMAFVEVTADRYVRDRDTYYRLLTLSIREV